MIYGALWIEMKTKDGQLSAAQRWWRDALLEIGHAWALCRSRPEAREVIEHYLDGCFTDLVESGKGGASA